MATGQYATQGASDNRFDSGTSSAAVSENEDLANFISMITRSETPFMASIGKTKATGIYHEWQTDELNDPTDSSMVQGADFDNVGPDGATNQNDGGNTISKRSRTRLGNYTQINGKTVSVSGTKRAIDQTGVADEYAYQLKKRGTEMRRDIERDLIHSVNVSTPGTSSDKGKMGGVYSWINGVDHVVFPGSSTFFSPNSGVAGQHSHSKLAETGEHCIGVNGGTATKQALTLSLVDEAMQNIYEAGGSAGRAMMSPKNRRVFSGLAQGANSNVRRNIDESGALRASVDVYMSDFGDLQIEPNYIMGLTNSVSMTNYDSTSSPQASVSSIDLANFMILIYDPQWWKIATLRPMKEVDVGQKGDSTVGMVVEEQTVQCSNPKGSSAIYGLNGS